MEENNNENKVDEINSNKEQKNVKKSTIIPSYLEKEKQITNNNGKAKKRRVKSKISLVILILLIALVAIALFFGISLIIRYNSNKAYEEYSDKMDIYGFDTMYDNEKATNSDYVRNDEAIKIILSSVLNTSSIPLSIGEDQVTNQSWINYASDLGLNFNISNDNIDKKASYLDCIMYLSEFKKSYLKSDLDVNGTFDIEDIEDYTNEEQIAIKDMINNKVINDVYGKIKAKEPITKGKLSQLIVNFVEHYNLLVPEGEKLAINKEKMPSNKSDYPYVLYNINKSVYEKEFYVSNNETFKKPSELYADIKDDTTVINIRIGRFLDTILNIDYKTIDKNIFVEELNKCLATNISSEQAETYIKFIKNNEIVVKGTYSVQMPIIYNDGMNIRVRTKVNMNIINSKELNNVLYGDSQQKYELGEKEVYIDIPLTPFVDGDGYYIRSNSIFNWISGEVKE